MRGFRAFHRFRIIDMYDGRITAWILFLLGCAMLITGLASFPIPLISPDPGGLFWLVVPGAALATGGLMMIVRRMNV